MFMIQKYVLDGTVCLHWLNKQKRKFFQASKKWWEPGKCLNFLKAFFMLRGNFTSLFEKPLPTECPSVYDPPERNLRTG
jgi:hypothetical protein